MKKYLIYLVLAHSLLAQAPSWYGVLDQMEPNYIIIGYGESEDFQKAKNNARDDISKSIRTTIKSSYSSSKRVHGDEVDSKIALTIEAKNSATLTNVQLLRKEQIDGVWYVAMRYDNRPIEEKIFESFRKKDCVEKSQVHPYILASPLYKKIKKTLGCDIDFTIIRHQKMWYVKAFDDQFPMAPLDFEKLFFDHHNEHLSFKANTKMLIDGQEFLFHAQSDASGFVTLLTMYEDGIVTLLEGSHTIVKDKESELPSPEKELVLEAATLENGSATFDLYVLIFSKRPLDTSRFEYATESLATSETAYKFEELLDLMQGDNYATVRLTTQPR